MGWRSLSQTPDCECRGTTRGRANIIQRKARLSGNRKTGGPLEIDEDNKGNQQRTQMEKAWVSPLWHRSWGVRGGQDIQYRRERGRYLGAFDEGASGADAS